MNCETSKLNVGKEFKFNFIEIVAAPKRSYFHCFLAHLWGAYAIPLALSVVRCVSSVSAITTRNNEAIKCIFSANVYHVPGLC